MGFYKPLIFLFFLFLCFVFAAKAQEIEVHSTPVAEADAKHDKLGTTPLKVGDKIPEELWDIEFSSVSKTSKLGQYVKLGDFKDKLILLDFWATWCAPCITLMPEIARLETEFEGRLQPFLVTSEDQDKIKKFFEKQELSLESIVEDSLLKKLFPKKTVPHEIWIKDSKVFAITDPYFVNEKTIKEILDNKISTLPEKVVNRTYDNSKPLLIDGNGGTGKDLRYHSIITGYLPGVGGSGKTRDDSGNVKIRALNGTAFNLFSFVAGRIDLVFYHKNRVSNQTSVQSFLENLSDGPLENRRHFFSYELMLPKNLEEMASSIMMDELNLFFGHLYGIQGSIKMVNKECLVLKTTDRKFTGYTKGGKKQMITNENRTSYKNVGFQTVFSSLAKTHSRQPYPFVNETDIVENVDMEVSLDGDVTETRKLLENYGLDLVLEPRSIEILVLEDKIEK